jgi:fucose permease
MLMPKTMSRKLIIFSLASTYFVFAIMLNSVGTVILQSIESFGITKTDASVLEGFKDLSIAIVSFLIASMIPRIGYKVAMLLSLTLLLIACLIVPIFADFWVIKIMFALVGTAFALAKVSVYAVIGQVTDSDQSHSSLMNTIEGIFMLGVLSGYWIFAGFIEDNNSDVLAWLNVYYLLAVIVLMSLAILAVSPIQKEKQSQAKGRAMTDFLDMLKLSYQPLVIIFVISIFLYVLIEQGIGTWLPTFNREVIGLPVSISVQLTSVFAIAIAIGRLSAGQILKKVHWYPFLNTCLILMAMIILVSLPLTSYGSGADATSIWEVPLAAFLLPVVGLMMAPIYPILNSIMLRSLPKHQHAPMTGLIVVFSALGGTTGSIVTGITFDNFGGHNAFYMVLIPITALLVSIAIFRKKAQQCQPEEINAAV